MMKKHLLVACLMAACAYAVPASADTIQFDPDGGTGALAFRNIDNLDWAVGNAIGIGFTLTSPVGTTFQTYYQANLGQALLSGGAVQYNNNTGAAGTLDSFTLVLGFRETVATSTFNPATGLGTDTFTFTPGGDNFFRIFANTDPGDNLSGACFVCGSIVMSGTINGNGFNETASGTGLPVGALDQAGANNYAGVGTAQVSGGLTAQANIGFVDPNFFKGLLPGQVLSIFLANASVIDPYNQADPSACFLAITSTGGLTPTCTGAGSFVGVGSVGTTNGLSGPNSMIQADANTSVLVTSPIPEPATLTLFGIGLLGTRFASRRRKK